MISFDDGATFSQEIFPLKLGSLKFTRDTRDSQLAKGRMFIRRHMNQPLELDGEGYNLIVPYERQPSQRCVRLYVRQERNCGGMWIPFWTGRFSAGSGTWDHSHCWASFNVEVFDRYSCLMDRLEKRQNILLAEAVDIIADIDITIEFGVVVGYRYEEFGGANACFAGWEYPEYPRTESWGVAFTIPPPDPLNGSYGFIVLWRELFTTNCINGIPVPPIGTGWALLTNNCGIDGTAVFWRVPVFQFPGPEMVYGAPVVEVPDCEDGFEAIMIHPGGPADLMSTIDCHPDLPPLYICFPTNIVHFSQARTLGSVMGLLLEGTGCTDLGNVVSDFFEINPPGDAPGYSPGINYVTGAASEVNNIFVIQKSDAALPMASQPALIEEKTLGDMLLLFLRMFEAFWDIDAAGNLRIEHWTFWVYDQGLDLTDAPNFKRNKNLCKYDHLQQRIPQRERFKMVDMRDEDFIGVDIIYDSPCVTQNDDGSVEEITAEVTTDLAFVYQDPDAVDLRGIVLVATAPFGSTFQVINGTGILSGDIEVNEPLSWSALHDAFFRHRRYLIQGNMNSADVTFDGIRPSIQQVPVTTKMCCDLFFMDPNDTVKTQLGDEFLVGRQGVIYGEEIDDASNVMTLTLRYAY